MVTLCVPRGLLLKYSMFCRQSPVTLFVWLRKTAIISLYCLTRVETWRWRRWLRHCVTSLKVAGSIPIGVVGIFRWLNPSGRTMSLGSTQPPTEIEYQDYFLGLKAVGAYSWQSVPLSCADCLEIWDSQPPGTLRMSSLLIYLLRQHICFYNWDGACLLCGRNGIFKCVGV
jgi:hypothetical protein